jgi:hypothetical protein
MQIETTHTAADEINALDQKLTAMARTSVNLAIRIGMLLSQQKKSLPHGHWLKWLQANVTLSIRRVDRYLMIYDNREQLKMANVSNLTEAYALLAPPKRMQREEAAARGAEIREGLHALCDLSTKVSASITKLQAIRDSRAYLPRHETFGAYLESLNISLSSFDVEEELCRAATSWMQGGSALPLLDAMWRLHAEDEPLPWQEAAVA